MEAKENSQERPKEINGKTILGYTWYGYPVNEDFDVLEPISNNILGRIHNYSANISANGEIEYIF